MLHRPLQPQPSMHFVTSSWEEKGQEKAACENSIRAGRAAGLHPTSTHSENLWSHHGDQAGGRAGGDRDREETWGIKGRYQEALESVTLKQYFFLRILFILERGRARWNMSEHEWGRGTGRERIPRRGSIS